MGVSGNLSQEVCTKSHYAQDQHVLRDTTILYSLLIYIKYFPFLLVLPLANGCEDPPCPSVW